MHRAFPLWGKRHHGVEGLYDAISPAVGFVMECDFTQIHMYLTSRKG